MHLWFCNVWGSALGSTVRDVIICNARLVETSSLTAASPVTRTFGLSPPSPVSGGDCVSDPSRGLWLIAGVDSSGVSMFKLKVSRQCLESPF